jgi:hypothetical protein
LLRFPGNELGLSKKLSSYFLPELRRFLIHRKFEVKPYLHTYACSAASRPGRLLFLRCLSNNTHPAAAAAAGSSRGGWQQQQQQAALAGRLSKSKPRFQQQLWSTV